MTAIALKQSSAFKSAIAALTTLGTNIPLRPSPKKQSGATLLLVAETRQKLLQAETFLQLYLVLSQNTPSLFRLGSILPGPGYHRVSALEKDVKKNRLSLIGNQNFFSPSLPSAPKPERTAVTAAGVTSAASASKNLSIGWCRRPSASRLQNAKRPPFTIRCLPGGGTRMVFGCSGMPSSTVNTCMAVRRLRKSARREGQSGGRCMTITRPRPVSAAGAVKRSSRPHGRQPSPNACCKRDWGNRIL